MTAFVQTYWNPVPLKAAIARAQALAVKGVETDAKRNCEWRHVREEIHAVSRGNAAAVGGGGPDSFYLEKGTRPHLIDPGGGGPSQVLRLASGDFVRGPVRHPGTRGKPFLRPAAARYAELFRAAARAVLPHPKLT